MKVLVINPGATSTKVAVFEEERELLKKSIIHTAQELEGFDRVIDQAELRQRAVLEALPFGGGCVNDTVVHLADPRLPFGGVGNSGMGACHGKAGFDAFTHEKSVLKKGRLDIPVRYPPYGKKHLGILKKLM